MKLWKYIKTNMLLHPNQKICENDIEFTFEQFLHHSEAFAKKLYGIKCCAILCNSQMLSAVALLGCFRAGVTAIPLSPNYGELLCKKIIDFISPEAVITHEKGKFKIRYCKHSNYISPRKKPSLIMCTSGTTGKPKGVMLSEKNIITNVQDISKYFAVDTTDTILIARPLYHCAVLTGEFLTSLVNGVNIRFFSETFNPIRILHLIDEFKITVFGSTPTLINMLLKLKRANNMESLKTVTISGECLPKQIGINISHSFANCKIYHVYGLTEACPRVSYLPPKLFNDYSDCVGVPLKSVSIKILNKNSKPCNNDEEGILWVKGKNVMLGYYNDSKSTKKALKRGWLCTGDIAVLTKNNLLKIKGRQDDLIIKSGMNIYPGEVENALRVDPRTKEVLAYSFDGNFLKQIGIKIVGDFSSTDEVRKMCAELLPTFQVPARIEIVDQLPKNASGKIIRRI